MGSEKGYVYVISNPSMPGVVKIGRSVAGGAARAKQLHTTAIPEEFVLEFEVFCDDPDDVERSAHELLDERRVAHNREFFRADADEASETVLRAVLAMHNQAVITDDEKDALEDMYRVSSEAGIPFYEAWAVVGWLQAPDYREAAARRDKACERQKKERRVF